MHDNDYDLPNYGYDGQGKTEEEETHGAMVAVTLALLASLAFFIGIGILVYNLIK